MHKSTVRFSDYLTSILDLDFFSDIHIRPRYRLDEIVIFGHVHCLPSLAFLIEALARVGIPGRQIYILAKPYSTIPSAVEALKKLGVTVIDTDINFRPGLFDESANYLLEAGVARVYRQILARPKMRRLVLVDDGGLLTAAWWRKAGVSRLEVISVQQTASGFGKHRLGRSPFAKIDVARSAAKRLFEAKIIVDGVLAKISSDADTLKDSRRVAVIGSGALGSRLARLLVEMGKDVSVYDRAAGEPISGTKQTDNWRCCIRHAEIVFGCTGANWLDIRLSFSPSVKSMKLISCSSRDVEFRSLLQHWSATNHNTGLRFAPIQVVAPSGLTGEVVNWGFPINFDRVTEWESESDIALTRALIYGGILQALSSEATSERERIEPLFAEAQQALVGAWLDWQGKTPELFGVTQLDFDDLSWWRNHSIVSEKVEGRTWKNLHRGDDT